ncbi:MAG TPA: hypothetical protein VF549_08505 [Solirubrobacteraceae bacterium]
MRARLARCSDVLANSLLGLVDLAREVLVESHSGPFGRSDPPVRPRQALRTPQQSVPERDATCVA